MAPGFETLNFKLCKFKVWELTVVTIRNLPLPLPMSVTKTLLWRRTLLGNLASKTPNQGLESSFCCCVAVQGLTQRNVFFTDTCMVWVWASQLGSGSTRHSRASNASVMECRARVRIMRLFFSLSQFHFLFSYIIFLVCIFLTRVFLFLLYFLHLLYFGYLYGIFVKFYCLKLCHACFRVRIMRLPIVRRVV